MPKTIEVYFGLNVANLTFAIYNAGTTALANATIGTTTGPLGAVVFAQSSKPGYFVGNVGNLAAGLYDLVESQGLGVDQVQIEAADNVLYPCFGHSNAWAIDLETKVEQIYNGGSGAGQYSLSVSVAIAGGSTPINRALVSVLTTSGALVAWGYANNLGVATIPLNAGDYRLNVSATGFTAQANVAHSVTSNSATHAKAISLQPQTIAPLPAAGICTIALGVFRGMAAVPNAQILVELDDQRSAIPEGAQAVTVANTSTDAAGLAELRLPYSSSIRFGNGFYRIKITDPRDGFTCHERKFTVPDSPTANYYDLPEPT